MTALLDDDGSKDEVVGSDADAEASANGAGDDDDDDEELISQDEIDSLFG